MSGLMGLRDSFDNSFSRLCPRVREMGKIIRSGLEGVISLR